MCFNPIISRRDAEITERLYQRRPDESRGLIPDAPASLPSVSLRETSSSSRARIEAWLS